MKTYKFQVFRVWGKAWTLLGKKEQNGWKDEEKKAWGSPNAFGESPNDLNLAQSSSVLSPEGKYQVGDEK